MAKINFTKIYMDQLKAVFKLSEEEINNRVKHPKAAEHVRDVANGKRHKAGGLHWEWVDNEQSNSEIIIETEN